MAGIVCETGVGILAPLDLAFFTTSGNAVSVGLIKTAAVLTDWDLVPGDLDPATFTGSTPIATTSWELGSAVGFAIPIQTTTPLVFTVTALTNLPQTIFGYAVYADSGADLIYVENFAAGILLNTVGQVINLTPRLLVGNCP